jgi:hypothetical protein
MTPGIAPTTQPAGVAIVSDFPSSAIQQLKVVVSVDRGGVNLPEEILIPERSRECSRE